MKWFLILLLSIANAFAASNTVYDVMNMSMVDKKAVNFSGQKISANVEANASTNIDLTLSDDSLFTGAIVYAPGACLDDEIKFQILMGSTVIIQFIDWFVASGLNKEIAYPAKIPAGLTMRAVYKNTCSNQINVKINYSLHKILQ
jgi:phage tail sheath gpL-like